MSPGPVHLLLLVLVAQRLAELAWSRRNERRLRARGAVEHGAAHYPLIVALHGGLLAVLALLAPGDRPIALPWLALLLALQPLRAWALLTLGERWTTRVLVLPGTPPVGHGPYRLLRHPNYLVVALEVPVIALAAGEPWAALGFGLANLALLGLRIRVEDRALGRPAGRAPDG